LPLYQKKLNQSEKQRKLEADLPWLSSLEAFLSLCSYKKLKVHSDHFIGKNLGIVENQVKLGLKLLIENESISKISGKYQLNVKRVDMESESLKESAVLGRHLTEMALRRFNTLDCVPKSKRGWAYRVFPASEDAQKKIRAKINALYGDIHRIIAEDAGSDKTLVQYFLIHFFDHEEFLI
jgi:hypothetical protein